MTTWERLPEDTTNYIGFIYIIINNYKENTIDPPIKKYYIGKKQLLKKTRLKKNNTRKRDKIVWKDNDVEKYWGSSKELLQDIEKYGIENFRRVVIEMCTSKWHMTYSELAWQMEFNAIIDPTFYNGILNCRLVKCPKGYVDIERNRDNLNL